MSEASLDFSLRVRSLLKQTFGLSEDQMTEGDVAWQEWLSLGKDFGEFLGSEVREEFKARCVVTLVAPSAEWSPFAWATPRLTSWPPLTPRLQEFCLTAIEVLACAQMAPSPRIMDLHNRFILGELEMLSEDDPRAERLARRYQPYFEDCSEKRCLPFEDVMGASIAEKWKTLADQKMRSEIARDVRLLGEYMSVVRAFADCYGTALLASQVEFILDLPGMDEGRIYALGSFLMVPTIAAAVRNTAGLQPRADEIRNRLDEVMARDEEERRPLREKRLRAAAQQKKREEEILAKMM